MRFNAPPISDLRLQRFHRWILLWLKWFAAFLSNAEAFAPFSQQATAIAHGWLDVIEQRLINLIVLRAFVRANRWRLAPKHSPHRRKQKQLRRAIIGSKLRRAFRAEDLRTRIERLSQDLNVLVVQLLKRLPLSRRRPIKPHPEARDPQALITLASPRVCADTS